MEKNLPALRRQDHRRVIGGVIGWPGAAVAGCGTGAKRKGEKEMGELGGLGALGVMGVLGALGVMGS